jgi:hypothetical protein
LVPVVLFRYRLSYVCVNAGELAITVTPHIDPRAAKCGTADMPAIVRKELMSDVVTIANSEIAKNSVLGNDIGVFDPSRSPEKESGFINTADVGDMVREELMSNLVTVVNSEVSKNSFSGSNVGVIDPSSSTGKQYGFINTGNIEDMNIEELVSDVVTIANYKIAENNGLDSDVGVLDPSRSPGKESGFINTADVRDMVREELMSNLVTVVNSEVSKNSFSGSNVGVIDPSSSTGKQYGFINTGDIEDMNIEELVSDVVTITNSEVAEKSVLDSDVGVLDPSRSPGKESGFINTADVGDMVREELMSNLVTVVNSEVSKNSFSGSNVGVIDPSSSTGKQYGFINTGNIGDMNIEELVSDVVSVTNYKAAENRFSGIDPDVFEWSHSPRKVSPSGGIFCTADMLDNVISEKPLLKCIPERNSKVAKSNFVVNDIDVIDTIDMSEKMVIVESMLDSVTEACYKDATVSFLGGNVDDVFVVSPQERISHSIAVNDVTDASSSKVNYSLTLISRVVGVCDVSKKTGY